MNKNISNQSRLRLRAFKVLIVVVGILISARLFHIQVINHDYYQVRADSSQIKKFEIEPHRGQIYALDGSEKVPLAINQTQKKLIADPRFIGDTNEAARQLAEVTGASQERYQEMLDRETAYVELESALDLDVGEKVEDLELKGIALRDTTLRIYPEQNLAAHVLGFVNQDGEGQYGIEQYLNEELSGEPGLLSGTFDVRGVPVAVADNTEIPALDGTDITLSIDRTIQRYVEKTLEEGVKQAKSNSGSVVVMDPNTGKIQALANFPTYNPGEYNQVEDIGVFVNNAVSSPYEPGSVVKSLTMAHGLQSGAVTPSTTYYDPGFEVIDNFRIRNAGAAVEKTRTMTEVITRSVNTGVIHVLKNLNGNDQLDLSDKESLYSFFTTDLGLGQPTNIELAAEAAGSVTEPAQSSDVKYANMTFGQGLSLNMVHLASGLSTVINGGTYYQPSIIHSYNYPDGAELINEPKVIRSDVVSETVSGQIRDMMKTVVDSGGGLTARRSDYFIGGKTGTAQLPNPEGGYFEDKDTGSFYGFGASSDSQQYVVVVRVDDPQIGGFAGSQAAAPIFADISNWLINYYGIGPQEGVN